MSFVDDSETNVNRLIETSAAGGVGGFVGRRGNRIDNLFAGAYHPDSGHGSENEQILQWQIEDRKEKRSWMEYEAGPNYTGEPAPIGGYYELDTENIMGAYDELDAINQSNIEFTELNTPAYDLTWKSTGWDYEYEEFDSSVGRDRRNRMFDEDFINQSEENTERTVKEEEVQLNEQDFIIRSKINLQTVYKNDIGLSLSMEN